MGVARTCTEGEYSMDRKRWIFGAVAAVLSAGALFAPLPALADSDDDDDDGYRHRRRRQSYYRPYRVYRYYEDDRYDDRVYYRPTYTSYRYRCGDCGHRFSSSYWLSYHYRHSGCD
jgi:hypothetical protein